MFSFDIIKVYLKSEEKSKPIPRSHEHTVNSKQEAKITELPLGQKNLLQFEELVKEEEKKQREKRKYLLPPYHKP